MFPSLLLFTTTETPRYQNNRPKIKNIILLRATTQGTPQPPTSTIHLLFNMKTFATTLLLLASATAAYGHSKAGISNNLSYSFIQSKSSKGIISAAKLFKEPIRGRRLLEEDHVHGSGKPESR